MPTLSVCFKSTKRLRQAVNAVQHLSHRKTARCGAPAIEIHTGHYADATNEAARLAELERVREGVALGLKAGLIVNAGHGLHYHNTRDIAVIPGINELNIGHAIIARAVISGLHEAVREMKKTIESS